MKKFLPLLVIALAALVSCNRNQYRAELRIARTDGSVTVDTIFLKVRKGVVEYTLPQAALEGVDTLSLTPEFTRACAGEDGYYVNSQGILTRFLEGRQGRYSVWRRHPMPIAGAKTAEGCWLVWFPNCRFDTGVTIQCRDGVYSQTLSVVPFNHEPYADLLFRWYPLEGKDATYAGMGRLYRKIRLSQGGLVPLKDKVKDRPLLQYAVDYPEIRIRQGWKPVPCSVPHQTLENEPPMRVAVTFDKVCEIIDTMKAQGVPGAQLTLVGWNIRGHDGRFPTIFPPDPELGGEAGMKHLISYAQENGFQIVPHICTGDAYEISPDFDINDVALLPDGKRYSKFVYGGGKMHELCYEQAYKKFVVPYCDSLARMGFRGIAYNDVYSIVAPHACTDSNHKNNPEQAAEWARKTLREFTDKMGGAASEGGYDHLSADLDFALYISMLGPTTLDFKKLCDEYVPIWHIVYNGYIYSCPFSRTVNYPIKEPDFAMKMQEYGCHPTFYFYSAHRHDDRNWIGTPDCDLKAATPEEVRAAVEAIRKGWDYMKEYGYIQYLTMDDHEEIAPGVFKTTFSDGTLTFCNYTEADYDAEDVHVPARGWHIVKGSEAPEVPKFNAHRGLQPFGPENSIASLEAAAERRVWAIETDFRMTADSEVVCIHDGTLDRTTDGKGRVKDHTLQEIRSFRVKEVNTKPVRKRYDYAALTDRQRMIPTMDEYFDICRKGDCVAFVELKEDDGVIVRMNEAIERHGMTGRCVISSGKKPLLKAYRDSGGKELIHLIFGKTEDLDFLLELGNAAVAFNYPDLGTEIHLEHHGQKIDSLKELVDYCHSLGLKICFRAVDTQEDLERSLALGIDYLPTNNLW